MSDENEPLAQLKPLTRPPASLTHDTHRKQLGLQKTVFLHLHVGCSTVKPLLASLLRALSPPPSQPAQKDAGIENQTDLTFIHEDLQ